MAENRDLQFQSLLADAQEDPDVLRVFADTPYPGRGVLLYDADCGFCRWCVAKVLAWDRTRLIVPIATGSPESAALLADVEPARRLASWHFCDPGGAVFSAGAAFAPLLRLLPGGPPLAAFAERFPRGVERTYRIVASNRGALGALVTSGARTRSDRRIAACKHSGAASERRLGP
jgi:predicted DCC family thiol-disulfide oxidoreductase YuxK